MKGFNNRLKGVIGKVERSYLGISGLELSCLWDVKDEYAWKLFDRTIESNVGRELAILNSQYFDEQVLRRWEDKRSGTELEPIQIACKTNKVLSDGLTRLNLIMANQSGGFFYFYASGEGTSDVSFGNIQLDDENARVDVRREGILDAFGNVLFQRARFPTGIADAVITEFGACDNEEDPATWCWRVVLEPQYYLTHVQGQTWYNGSHYLVTYSR